MTPQMIEYVLFTPPHGYNGFVRFCDTYEIVCVSPTVVIVIPDCICTPVSMIANESMNNQSPAKMPNHRLFAVTFTANRMKKTMSQTSRISTNIWIPISCIHS